MTEQEKAAFFEQYAFAADAQVLEMIWQAKQEQATEMFFAKDCITDLSPLKGLTNLEWLDISHNQVSDLSPLKGLKDLLTLEASHTQVSDLSPLKDLKDLISLDVSYTQVSDVSPLKDIIGLVWLDISYTQVSDLSPLKDNGMHYRWEVDGTEDHSGIYIKGIPLRNPPIYITKQSDKMIRLYWIEQKLINRTQ